MNGLDIIIYTLSAGALFLLFTAGYALGHKDGKREGYTLGRSIARHANLPAGFLPTNTVSTWDL